MRILSHLFANNRAWAAEMQFAVEVLRVRDIIVCGHYGCGGVLAVLRDEKMGLIDNWLRHV